jgi:3-deoxy-7-phosphoheptulonate synthase
MLAVEGIVRPVMVDCSHGNSNKDFNKQGVAGREVIRQIRDGQPAIMGMMIESNLKPGAQPWKEGKKLEYGVSITDACIGWDETEALIQETAEAVAAAPKLANSVTK